MTDEPDEADLSKAVDAALRLIEVSGPEARSVAEEFLAKARAAANGELIAAWQLILRAVEAITEGPQPGEKVH